MPATTNAFGALHRPDWITWLRRELEPFPGRDITTLRIVVVVALVVIISMTLQVPQLPLSAFFVFFVTKENRALTLLTGVVMLIGSTIAVALSLFLYQFTFDYPELRIPVMAGLIFTGMFLSRVFSLGPLGFVIGFFAALMQTIAEGAPNTDVLVRSLLWLWVALFYPIALTVIVNQIFLPAHPWDGLVFGFQRRIDCAAEVLRRLLDTGKAGGRTNAGLLELASRGTAPMHALLGIAEAKDPVLQRRHGSLIATIAATDNLVSATAALEFRPEIAITEEDRICAEALLLELDRLHNAVRIRDLFLPPDNVTEAPCAIPQLRELHSSIKSFHRSLVGGNVSGGAPAVKPARKPLFVADAFTNPAHVRFALKVTFAAMLCYLIYSGLDWPGISTSFITCCFIALGSTGGTMRKAWLRIVGCCAGGLLGFLCLIFLVPHMESIVSLVLLTALVSGLAAWIATGTERLSYAGLQGAFAFYMCLFQGFLPDTNFTTIRDRIVGILLGIVVSSIVFHNLWPEHAIDGLRRTLAQVLRSVARLLLLPEIGNSPEAEEKNISKIRGEITRGLDTTLTQSELMMFENVKIDGPNALTPARLENMVAGTQALSLMTAALLGTVKLEEWRRLGQPVQQAEMDLRADAAKRLEQIAICVEQGQCPQPISLENSFAVWNQAVAPVTGNDRPRLVRRLVGHVRELI